MAIVLTYGSLDLNDSNGWLLSRGLNLGTASLEKTYLQQTPYDGAELATSHRPVVTMEIPLILTRQSNAMAMKALMDSLATELDKDENGLEYRPDGYTSSYFFTTFRADIPSLLKGDATVSPFALLQSPSPLVVRIDRMPAATYQGTPAYI